jgi:hypothetical protein
VCKQKCKQIFIVIHHKNVNSNKTTIWNKIIPHNGVKQIEHNKGFYLNLHPFGDIAHKSFHRGFHMPIDERTFLKAFFNYK